MVDRIRNAPKRTAGTGAADREDLRAVALTPATAISIVPDGLLHDVEERVGVSLVDLDLDGVGHAVVSIKGTFEGSTSQENNNGE